MFFIFVGKSAIKKQRKSPLSDQQQEKPTVIKKEMKESIIINHTMADNSGMCFSVVYTVQRCLKLLNSIESHLQRYINIITYF